ncbi:MAG: hypothetical protein R3290_10605 [Acidimicrobiia bacterium]|nr:hypothetical protein [Acidimicrobiia bacterium]
MTGRDDLDDAAPANGAEEFEPAPLGFKIVLAAAIGYLVLRVVQMVGWMF